MIGIHVAGRNCGKWARECIASVLSQSVQEWRMVVIDDQSTDDTWRVIHEAAGKDPRIMLLRNEDRRFGCWNHNETIRVLVQEFHLVPEDVLVCLDLDDAFLPGCLAAVVKRFESPDLWVSYGNWQDENKAPHKHTPFSSKVFSEIRTRPWFLTHVLAMRLGVWAKIPASFWGHNDGTPYENGWDGATMFACVDLAGVPRVGSIATPIYMHRKHHGASVKATRTKDFRNKAIWSQRGKPRLKPLASLHEGDGAEGASKIDAESVAETHREEVTAPERH